MHDRVVVLQNGTGGKIGYIRFWGRYAEDEERMYYCVLFLCLHFRF